MKAETQQKINMALMAINYMTNTLNVVNTEMKLCPGQGDYAEKFQKDREQIHENFLEEIVTLTNELGDYMNNMDALTEEDLLIINPIFDLINED